MMCDAGAVGVWSLPEDSRTAREGLSARIAAILQIAATLSKVGTQELKIVAVVNDGKALNLVVSGGPNPAQAGAAALGRASLWNAILLRPIRSIGVADRRPPPPLIGTKDSFAEAGRRVLRRYLEQLVSRQYGLPYNADAEFVHEMRVATRRLRAAMRIFRGAFADRFQQQTNRLRAGRFAGGCPGCGRVPPILAELRPEVPEEMPLAGGAADRNRKAGSAAALSPFAGGLRVGRTCKDFSAGCTTRLSNRLAEKGGLCQNRQGRAAAGRGGQAGAAEAFSDGRQVRRGLGDSLRQLAAPASHRLQEAPLCGRILRGDLPAQAART